MWNISIHPTLNGKLVLMNKCLQKNKRIYQCMLIENIVPPTEVAEMSSHEGMCPLAGVKLQRPQNINKELCVNRVVEWEWLSRKVPSKLAVKTKAEDWNVMHFVRESPRICMSKQHAEWNIWTSLWSRRSQLGPRKCNRFGAIASSSEKALPDQHPGRISGQTLPTLLPGCPLSQIPPASRDFRTS